MLKVKNLFVSVENKEILHGVNLEIKSKEIHVVMGPNGSGKSTLSQTIMGHPNYQVTKGEIFLDRTNILNLEPHERAQKGLLLAFQNPISVVGVTLSNLLRTAYLQTRKKDNTSVLEFHKKLQSIAEELNLDKTFLTRSLNDGFSGGEKKKAEILQLLALDPKFAIFDEIDTGLDIDALKIVAKGINKLQEKNCGILLITHYQRIVNYLTPSKIHVMKMGKILLSGNKNIMKQIEEEGYEKI